MAKTLLNGVNEVLVRVGLIQGDAGALSSLTDSARQVYVDVAVQAWNEVIERLYVSINKPMPQELAKSSITLIASDRDYALAADINQMRWPLLDETNGYQIHEYPGGYLQLIHSQLVPSNYTGRPIYGAIDPVDSELYLDRIPGSDDAGLVYSYWYDKDISLSLAADTFPFSDTVFRALVPAVTEIWGEKRRRDFNERTYRMSLGTAAQYLAQKVGNDSWLPKRFVEDVTDPFNA